MTSYNLLVAAAGASGHAQLPGSRARQPDSVLPTPGTHGHHGTYLANISLVAAPTV